MENNAKIAALNEKFSVAGRIQFMTGNGGLPKIQIHTRAVVAEIYLHGAQVSAWKPAGLGEVLFLSEKSHWQDGKAIRGGIPICFPWFRAKADDPKAPTHGFVRTKEWRVESIAANREESVSVRLSTESDDGTRRWWPYDFRLEYGISIGRVLKLELTMRNTGRAALQFEEALHTYFHVGDVEQAIARGLGDLAYLDNRDGNRKKLQSGDLRIAGQTDNAYLQATGAVEVVDPVLRRKLKTEKQNSSSAIVWNPWREGALSMTDLGDDEWRRMLCVEGGNIMDSAVTLEAGGTQSMTVTIRVTAEAGS